ncbi:MAG TPA: hypothetical protein VFP68_11870 [Burkholderiaceae bacterium]|nr:hypothetical protein [Burkholderiaceae bacterium]
MIALLEAALHGDALLHRLRSVFAAGRALDKLLYVQSHRPQLLIIGNSRADNGFDPATVLRQLPPVFAKTAFNLGIPGADTRVLAGMLDRLDSAAALGPGGIERAVIVLDEALVQSIDTLGQEVFFGNQGRMLADGQWHDALRASFRLYGYSSNLRQLREPGTFARFVEAMRTDVDPVGGGAALRSGYRPGFSGLQDSDAVRRQEAGSSAPPSPVNVGHLWRMLDLLARRGVQVAIVYAPLANRDVLYIGPRTAASEPFHRIAAELAARGLAPMVLDNGAPRDVSEFVNAGHLNDRGAQRYSRLLSGALAQRWNATAP